jgi:hypothetical protein
VAELTPRWTELRFHPIQLAYQASPHRFNTVPAGRRSGKTELAKRKLVRLAIGASTFEKPRYFAAAPTRQQAKRIFWQDLKEMLSPWMQGGQPSETELTIRLVNGAEIHVLGLDRPERIEGTPWDGGILDEYGNMRPEVWACHIRPALADRNGWCDLIGVPEGRNHYYDTVLAARTSMQKFGPTSEWGCFHWVSADILPETEVAAARRDLDPLTFAQEYEASFVNFAGRAYYAFSPAEHCAPLAYDRRQPLIFCFDFNVAPGVAVICQEQRLPNGEFGTGVIGEVHIPNNSTTQAVCRKLLADWGGHEGWVRCYGDATGGARGSSRVQGSDWDLIRAELRPRFQDRLSLKAPAANPPERARLNAVNARLKNGDGAVRLMVDGARAGHVVKDLDGVRLLAGGAGEIDKRADDRLSHLSDALGYYIVAEFPLAAGAAARSVDLPFMAR